MKMSCAGEESSDLNIGIFARLQPLVKFQDETVAIDDGRIRLFGRHDARGKSLRVATSAGKVLDARAAKRSSAGNRSVRGRRLACTYSR